MSNQGDLRSAASTINRSVRIPHPSERDQQSIVIRTPGSMLSILIVKSRIRSTADTMLSLSPEAAMAHLLAAAKTLQHGVMLGDRDARAVVDMPSFGPIGV
jgi:hypothetical protein